MENGRERQENTKKRLIEAAGEVFSEKGFRAATVREICGRARTNISAVNYHFRDKDGLYAAVLEYSHAAAIIKYPPDLGLKEGATAEQRLYAFIHSFLLRFLAEGYPSWHGKLMAQEISDPTRALAIVVEKSIRPLFNRLAGIIEDLLPAGRAADGEVHEAAYFCAMSVVGQC
ncbi:MAG: CerR family C-terminal domain-containing protein, partial [Desulfobacteraceae bacterium]|nr:CerR family C-terminal domain-containing protein [Desulfobacteraceae bacterium]